jgi:hypothetical protein
MSIKTAPDASSLIEAPGFHPVQYGARLGKQRIDR